MVMTLMLATLLVLVTLGLVGITYLCWRKGRTDDDESNKPVRFRINVLVLFVLAYGSIGGAFVLLLVCGVPAKEAYNLVSVPFVALIGGTLAVANDLI